MILKGEFGWGSAEGKIWLLPSAAVVPRFSSPAKEPPERVLKAVFRELAGELKAEKKRLKKGKEFLDFPLSVLQDPQLWITIQGFLRVGCAAGEAVFKAFRKWETALKKTDDSYLRLRIADLEDLRRRILVRTSGAPLEENVPSESFIAVAKDLYVTDFLRLQRSALAGIALEEGNESAHGVMLAKALGIPLAGKVKGLLGKARAGEFAILSRAKIYLHEPAPKMGTRPFVNPSASTRDFKTRDNIRITVQANVQIPEEIEKAKTAGAMGVGLFRTEFLWMQRRLSLKEEAAVYRRAIEVFSPHPVVFRLADLGSDKPYAKVSWPSEKNPALGWRGLRFLLDRPEILSRQLEALYSAASGETLHLLLPMVRTREEIEEFLEILKPFVGKHKTKPELGIMIETPSAADLIGWLPREIRFASLGTNDLLQYFFAVDRLHPHLKADFLHPAFLRFLNEITRRCARAKMPLSVCGEMAANAKALPVLLGLGIRKFSVSVAAIPETARVLARISARAARRQAAALLRS